MKKYLPIGSVIVLNGGTKRLMICGRAQFDQDKKYFDYSGCLYPEGYIGASEMYLFNEENIDKIFFIGFQDEEGIDYSNRLGEKIEEYLEETEHE